jgi:hypothetical protein
MKTKVVKDRGFIPRNVPEKPIDHKPDAGRKIEGSASGPPLSLISGNDSK